MSASGMAVESGLAVQRRADELIEQFSISGDQEDLLALAKACEGFSDRLSRAAGEEIRRRALKLSGG